jgi:integrase
VDPVSGQSYGAQSRQPVYTGKRRVPGLYERKLASGGIAFEAKLRLGGQLRRHRLEASTKTDAIAELRRLQVDFERGEFGRSSALALTVSELARDWLLHLEARTAHRDPRHRRSGRTVALYRQRLDSHILPALGTRDLSALTVADVRRLIDRLAAKKLAPSTITSTVNILSGLLRFGIKNGQLEHNPVRDLDRDDRPGAGRMTEPRYLSPDELNRLLGKMSDTFRPVGFLCAYAGLRVSEALGLRWRDVDFAAGTLSVERQLGPGGQLVPVKTTASAAPVGLLPVVVRELRAHHARQRERGFQHVRPEALVFTTSRGNPQSRRNALRAVHAAGDAAKLNPAGREKVGVHDLRHSLVANALAAGVTLPEAAELARHADARVTAIVYAGVTDAAREAIAAKLHAVGFGD